MRDFRDAKAMAQTLRDSLTTKAVTISHSESLELVSKMFGVADWNTLSALLHAERRDTAPPSGSTWSRPRICVAARLRLRPCAKRSTRHLRCSNSDSSSRRKRSRR